MSNIISFRLEIVWRIKLEERIVGWIKSGTRSIRGQFQCVYFYLKIKDRQESSLVQQPKKQQLDSMLGNLQASMDKQGVSATQKGVCAACHKPIVGQVSPGHSWISLIFPLPSRSRLIFNGFILYIQVVTALGKTWHPEHFTCAHCRQELGSKSFYEREGQPYCEDDYHKLYSPRCAYCNGPILDVIP